MLLARLNGQKIKVALVATSWLHATQVMRPCGQSQSLASATRFYTVGEKDKEAGNIRRKNTWTVESTAQDY